MDYSLPGSSCPWNFSGKNIGVGYHFPLPGDLPDLGVKVHFLHWQADSLPLVHLRRPKRFLKEQIYWIKFYCKTVVSGVKRAEALIINNSLVNGRKRLKLPGKEEKFCVHSAFGSIPLFTPVYLLVDYNLVFELIKNFFNLLYFQFSDELLVINCILILDGRLGREIDIYIHINIHNST